MVCMSGNITTPRKYLKICYAPRLLLATFVCVQYSNHSFIAVEIYSARPFTRDTAEGKLSCGVYGV